MALLSLSYCRGTRTPKAIVNKTTFSFRTGLFLRWANYHQLSIEKFSESLDRCLPENKYNSNNIAVAFSGGPDSTCLLYLLKQANTLPGRIPFNIVALTVDHSLQATSNEMTAQCIELAKKLEVQHRILKIPWGTKPFPANPSNSSPDGSPGSGKKSAIETVAREARYHLMFSAMQDEGIHTLLVGHHADDQLETALLRLIHGSGVFGAGGMRVRRRWGMGFGSGPGCLGWAGEKGLQKWIVRPLLDITKESLVDTCRVNGLNYVVDPTNAQPQLTERNRIRYWVKGLGEQRERQEQSGLTNSRYASASRALLSVETNISANSASNSASANVGPISVTRLRRAVKAVSCYVDEIELGADEELRRCLLPSPISTALIAQDNFVEVADEMKIAIIRRILRYVSPFPWGSPSSEAGGRTDGLNRISMMLSNRKSPTKLTAGAGVLWTPVLVGCDGKLLSLSKAGHGTRLAWLASRQPPIRRPGSGKGGWPDSEDDRMTSDITSELASAFRRDPSNGLVEILYDCRFLLRVRPHLLPQDVRAALSQPEDGVIAGKVLVVPHSRYFLPKLILRRKKRAPQRGFVFAENDGSGHDAVAATSDNGDSTEEDAELARVLPGGGVSVPWMRMGEVEIGEDNKMRGRVAGWSFPEDIHQGAFQSDFIRLLYN